MPYLLLHWSNKICKYNETDKLLSKSLTSFNEFELKTSVSRNITNLT